MEKVRLGKNNVVWMSICNTTALIKIKRANRLIIEWKLKEIMLKEIPFDKKKICYFDKTLYENAHRIVTALRENDVFYYYRHQMPIMFLIDNKIALLLAPCIDYKNRKSHK